MAYYLLISSVSCLLLFGVLVRRFQAPGALPFLAILLCLFFYGLGSGMELLTALGQGNRFWNHVLFSGAALLPGFWLWLSLETPQSEQRASPSIALAVLLLPAVTVVLQLTNESHHLVFSSLGFVQGEGGTRVVWQPGPWYWAHVVWSATSFVAGLILMVRNGVSWGILLAALPTAGGYVLPWTGLSLGSVDLLPLGLSISGVFSFFLLWPYGLLDLRTVTRETAFRLMPDPVLVIDPVGRFLDWNPSAERLFPALVGSKRGVWANQILSDRKDWITAMVASEGPERVLLPLGSAGGTWWALTRAAVEGRLKRPAAHVILLHEETELIERADHFQHQALTDELTGCLNRRAVMEKAHGLLGSRAARRESMAAIAIDLDHFKQINDTWGHATGDLVLKNAVRIWQGLLRSSDVLGRTGGEEFLVLLPGTRVEVALSIAERLCSRLRHSPLAGEHGPFVATASFGVAGAVDASQTSVDTLLKNADTALYEAKTRGRDRVVLGCLCDEHGSVQACLEPDEEPQ